MSIPARIRAIAHAHDFDVSVRGKCHGDSHINDCDLVCQLIQSAEQRGFKWGIESAAKMWTK